MHFEITYYVGNHPFIYVCTTAYEALDALSDIFQHEPIFRNHMDMDKIMELLLDLKSGKTLSSQTSKYMIKYLQGEV